MVTANNPSQAEARAQAKAKALDDPNSANSTLANAYDDHKWKPAVLDANTTDGIRNTLRAHAAAIQALADHIDGIHKAMQPKPKEPPRMLGDGDGQRPAL